MAARNGRGSFRSVAVIVEVVLKIPPRRAWRALTRDVDRWWPREFLSPKATRFVVEARPGGLVHEVAGKGEGLVWYRVVGVEAPRRLQLSGDLFPAYGGPGHLFTTFTLEPVKGGTRLRLEEVAFGRVHAKTGRALRDGWRTIFEKHLRPWAEKTR